MFVWPICCGNSGRRDVTASDVLQRKLSRKKMRRETQNYNHAHSCYQGFLGVGVGIGVDTHGLVQCIVCLLPGVNQIHRLNSQASTSWCWCIVAGTPQARRHNDWPRRVMARRQRPVQRRVGGRQSALDSAWLQQKENSRPQSKGEEDIGHISDLPPARMF